MKIIVSFLSIFLIQSAFAKQIHFIGEKAKAKYKELEMLDAEVTGTQSSPDAKLKVLRKGYLECSQSIINSQEEYNCLQYSVTKVSSNLSSEDFCENFKKEMKQDNNDGRSLKALTKALKLEGTLGQAAKDADKSLVEAGFYQKFENAKIDYDSIPKGSVFVFEKSGNCPVSKYGHVGVKCEDDKLIWSPNQAKSIAELVKDHPKCIKAVMVNPKWDVSRSNKSKKSNSDK